MDFATGALGTLIPKLGKLLKEEYDLQKSVKGKIKFLETELECMQAALRKVSGVPAEQLDENTRLWARNVRELSYDIEDSIDRFLVRVEGKKRGKPHEIKMFVDKTLSSLFNVKIKHRMASDIKDLEYRVKQVKEQHDRYNINGMVPTPSTNYVDPRLEALYKKATDLVGILGTKEKLINMLKKCDGPSKNCLKRVSIAGVGGLGKTTLAKAVFDELKVEFKCSAFISVGQNPDVKKVIKDILLELERNMYKDIHNLTRDVKQLIDLLRDFVDNKRYIIVIDDIWDTETWEIIKMALVMNDCESILITTTRKFDVAKEAGDVFNLEPLSTDHSRDLLYTRLFTSDGDRNCLENEADHELTEKILRKCGGIPLAIITMASLLAGKPINQWFEVYSSIGHNRKHNSQFDTTMEILSLSYYDMPSHLRTCLLYLSVFPEDSYIKKDSLIWMWVAEGFVHVEQGVGLFEVGERYLNELISRSMVQPCGDDDGRIFGCRLHDMVLELICSLSSRENFVTILDNVQGTLSHRNVRRLSQQKMRIEHNPEAAVDMIHVRSFAAFSCTIAKMIPFTRFQVLRVLILEYCETQNNHLTHLGELLLLRYLRLRDETISELPKGIGAIKFLQVLDIEGTAIRELPSTVSELTQLACLRCCDFSMVEVRVIRKLTSLQELRLTIISPAKSFQICEALGNLSELRVLRAEFENLDSNEEDALMESLNNMPKLHHLQICSSWGWFKVEQVSRWHASGAVLPQHIKVLHLNGVRFSRLPSCINASALPSLSELSLSVDLIDYRDIRIFGKFPELWLLCVWTSSSVTSPLLVVYGGDGYFRKLRSLYVYSDAIVVFRGRKIETPVMPSLEVLHFGIHVDQVKDYCVHCCQNVSCLLSMLGWHHLPSLKKVNYGTVGYNRPEDNPVEEEAKLLLNQAANSHSNSPIIHRGWSGYDKSDLPDSPKVLDLPIHVWMFRDTGVGFDLSNLAILEKVTALIYCHYTTPGEVLQVEAALRHAVDIHPNSVILEMERCGEDEMEVLFTEQNEQLANHDATEQNEENITAVAGTAAAEEEVYYDARDSSEPFH